MFPCVPGFADVVKDCLLVRTILLPMTSVYINTLLICDIRSRDMYNLQFTPIKWRNNIFGIMLNYTFNACVESRKYCSHIFASVITIWTYLQRSGISTYIYTISHSHINPVSYHIVHVSHCREILCTVISRRIHPMCTMWYDFPITEQMCVR